MTKSYSYYERKYLDYNYFIYRPFKIAYFENGASGVKALS